MVGVPKKKEVQEVSMSGSNQSILVVEVPQEVPCDQGRGSWRLGWDACSGSVSISRGCFLTVVSN
eukprot:10622851-Prorocentrum_lima.AAC.1